MGIQKSNVWLVDCGVIPSQHVEVTSPVEGFSF